VFVPQPSSALTLLTTAAFAGFDPAGIIFVRLSEEQSVHEQAQDHHRNSIRTEMANISAYMLEKVMGKCSKKDTLCHQEQKSPFGRHCIQKLTQMICKGSI